jgi:hypothetical protein
MGASISDHGHISDGQQVHDDTNRLTVTDNWLMVMDDDGWWILTLDRSLREVQKYRQIILRFARKKKNLTREPTCVWNILAVSGKFKCGVRISTDGISVVLGMEAKILLVRASHHHLGVHRKLEYEFGTEPCECVVESTSGIRIVVRRDSGDNGRLNSKCRQCRSTSAQLTCIERVDKIPYKGLVLKRKRWDCIPS